MERTFSHAAGEWLTATTRADIKNLALTDRLTVWYVPARRAIRLHCVTAPTAIFEFPVRTVYAGILYEILERFAMRRFPKPIGAKALVQKASDTRVLKADAARVARSEATRGQRRQPVHVQIPLATSVRIRRRR